jgi:hypothetical protein
MRAVGIVWQWACAEVLLPEPFTVPPKLRAFLDFWAEAQKRLA